MPIQISKNMAKRWQTLFNRANETQNITAHVPFLQLFIIKINRPQPTDLESLYGKAIEEIKQYSTEATPEPLRSFARVMMGCLLILDDSNDIINDMSELLGEPTGHKTNLEKGIEYLHNADLAQTGGLHLPLDDPDWLRVAQHVDFEKMPQDKWSRYIYDRTSLAAINMLHRAIQNKSLPNDSKDEQEKAVTLLEKYLVKNLLLNKERYIARHILLEFYAMQQNLPKIHDHLAHASPEILKKLSTEFWRRSLVHLYGTKDTKEFVSKYQDYIANILIRQLDRATQHQFPAPKNFEDFAKELHLITETGIKPLSSIAAYFYVVYLAYYPEGDASLAWDDSSISPPSTEYWYKHINMEELESFNVHPIHFTIVQVAEQLEEMIKFHRTLLVNILNNLANPILDTPEAKKAWQVVGKCIERLPEETIKQIFTRYGEHILASIDVNETSEEAQKSLENMIKYGTPPQQATAHMLLGAYFIHPAGATDDRKAVMGIKHLADADASLATASEHLTDDDFYKMMIRNRIPEAFDNNTSQCETFVRKFMPTFYELALTKYETSKGERFSHPDKQAALAALKLITDYGAKNSPEQTVASYILISEHATSETQYRNINDVGAPIVGNTILEDYITNIRMSPDIRAALADLGAELTPEHLLALLERLPARVFENNTVRQFLFAEIENYLSETIDQSEIKQTRGSFDRSMDHVENEIFSILPAQQALYVQTLRLYAQFTERCPASAEKNQALYRQAALAAHTRSIDDAIVYFTQITPSQDQMIVHGRIMRMPFLSPTQLQRILVRSAKTGKWNCWEVMITHLSLAKNIDFQSLLQRIEASRAINMRQWEQIPINTLTLLYRYGSSHIRDHILKYIFTRLNEENKKILGKTILQYSDMRNLLKYPVFMYVLNSVLPVEEMLDLLIDEKISSELKDKITQYLISRKREELFEILELPDRFGQQKRHALVAAQLVYNNQFRATPAWMHHCETHKVSPIPAFMLLSPQEQIEFTRHWYPENITQLLQAFSVFMQKHTITLEVLQTINTLLQTRGIINKLSSDTVFKLFEVMLKLQKAGAITIIQNCIAQLDDVQKRLVLSALLKHQNFIEISLEADETAFIQGLTTQYIKSADAEGSWEDISAIYANFRPNAGLKQHLLTQIFSSSKHITSMRRMLEKAEKNPTEIQKVNWPIYRFLPKLLRTLNQTGSDAWQVLFADNNTQTALQLADLLQRPWVRDCLSKDSQDKLDVTEARLHEATQTGWRTKFTVQAGRVWTRMKYLLSFGKEKELHVELKKRSTVSEAAPTGKTTTWPMLERELHDRGDLPEHQRTVVLMAQYVEALKNYKRQIRTMKKVPEETLKKLRELLIAIELTQPDCNTAGHKYYTEQLINAFENLLVTQFDEIAKDLPDQENAAEKDIQLKQLRRQHADVLKLSYERLGNQSAVIQLIVQERLFKPLQRPLLDAAETMRNAADELHTLFAPDDKRPKPRPSLWNRLLS